MYCYSDQLCCGLFAFTETAAKLVTVVLLSSVELNVTNLLICCRTEPRVRTEDGTAVRETD